MTQSIKQDKIIRDFAKRLAKQGLTAHEIANKAQDKFIHEMFKVVNGHVYREDDKALTIVLTNDYIKKYAK